MRSKRDVALAVSCIRGSPAGDVQPRVLPRDGQDGAVMLRDVAACDEAIAAQAAWTLPACRRVRPAPPGYRGSWAIGNARRLPRLRPPVHDGNGPRSGLPMTNAMPARGDTRLPVRGPIERRALRAAGLAAGAPRPADAATGARLLTGPDQLRA